MIKQHSPLVALLVILLLLGAACRPDGGTSQEDAGLSTTDTSAESGDQARPVMGPGSGMMARHHATIPAEYAGLTNPVTPDEDSLAQGAALYTAQCATCHGQDGLGDGPAAAGLDPAPAPLAHTGRMMGDDYLFWRISEGGAMAPFNSAMPTWKATVEEMDRWHLINYIRSMSGGAVPTPMSPQEEAAKRAEMLDRAVDEGVITQDEAILFDQVHTHMDELLAESSAAGGQMMGQQDDVISRLVEEGTISEEQARIFNDVHDRLLAAGLMQ